MTTISRPIIDAKNCETSLTLQYTAPAGGLTQIDKVTATNTTGAAITVTVHLVPLGGAADATNKIISDKSIAAGVDESLAGIVGHTLKAGDGLVMAASATGLTIRASGRETT